LIAIEDTATGYPHSWLLMKSRETWAPTRMNKTTQNATPSDLTTIKDEIQQLKTIIATADLQITQALASLPNNNRPSPSNEEMETDATNATDPNNPTTLDLLAIINELKNEILNFTQETRAIVHTRCNTPMTTNHPAIPAT